MGLARLRWSEVASLKVSALHLGSRRLHVVAAPTEAGGHDYLGPPKSRASRRYVALPSLLIEELNAAAAGKPARVRLPRTRRRGRSSWQLPAPNQVGRRGYQGGPGRRHPSRPAPDVRQPRSGGRRRPSLHPVGHGALVHRDDVPHLRARLRHRARCRGRRARPDRPRREAMTSATNHHDQGVDALVDLLVEANARNHDLWGFLALAMARAANRVSAPHRLIGPRWDTEGGGVVMEPSGRARRSTPCSCCAGEPRTSSRPRMAKPCPLTKSPRPPGSIALRQDRLSNDSQTRAESTVTAMVTATDGSPQG